MMPRSGTGIKRQVVIFISRDEWRVLTALAEAAERDQYQQARWLLREALAAAAAVGETNRADVVA